MNTPPGMQIRRIIRYSGRVQGVGFRYTAQNIALQYNVRGYVKNLQDGRVELVLEGPEPAIDQIGHCIANKMAGFIQSTTTEIAPATGEFVQFAIRH